MDRQTVELEIRRLAPWFHHFELMGASTADTPPCDHRGHRRIQMPRVREDFWEGRSVLDMGCAEGALSFGALQLGAASSLAVDCREENLEKGRFVARVLGQDRIAFEQGSAEQWPSLHEGRTFDIVLFCGLLYHLQNPLGAIRDYCSIAERAVMLTSAVYGGEHDGWTLWHERDTIAASEGAVDSYMPNTTETIVLEFGRHSFVPTHVRETHHADFAYGCEVLFERVAPGTHRPVESSGDGHVDVHVGRVGRKLTICIYSRLPHELAVRARLRVTDERGRDVLVRGPIDLRLAARHGPAGRRNIADLRPSFSHDFSEDLGEAVAARTAIVELESAAGQPLRRVVHSV